MVAHLSHEDREHAQEQKSLLSNSLSATQELLRQERAKIYIASEAADVYQRRWSDLFTATEQTVRQMKDEIEAYKSQIVLLEAELAAAEKDIDVINKHYKQEYSHTVGLVNENRGLKQDNDLLAAKLDTQEVRSEQIKDQSAGKTQNPARTSLSIPTSVSKSLLLKEAADKPSLPVYHLPKLSP